MKSNNNFDYLSGCVFRWSTFLQSYIPIWSETKEP